MTGICLWSHHCSTLYFYPALSLRLPPPSSFLSASLAIFHFFFSIANPDQLKSPLYHSRISTFTLSSRIPPLSNSASFLFIFLPPTLLLCPVTSSFCGSALSLRGIWASTQGFGGPSEILKCSSRSNNPYVVKKQSLQMTEAD